MPSDAFRCLLMPSMPSDSLRFLPMPFDAFGCLLIPSPLPPPPRSHSRGRTNERARLVSSTGVPGSDGGLLGRQMAMRMMPLEMPVRSSGRFEIAPPSHTPCPPHFIPLSHRAPTELPPSSHRAPIELPPSSHRAPTELPPSSHRSRACLPPQGPGAHAIPKGFASTKPVPIAGLPRARPFRSAHLKVRSPTISQR